MRPILLSAALLAGLLLMACGPDEQDTRSSKMPVEPVETMKSPAQIEEALAFTCTYEKDRIPPRDPEADMLFEHANWRSKKNRMKEDKAVYLEVERLYRIATAWGHDKAANNLFNMILRGQSSGVDRETKPAEIARDLTERGIPHGYFLTGFLLKKGLGVQFDYDAGEQYSRKAADLGDPDAQYSIGDKLHRMGIDKPVPYKVGKEMKRCAADQGHAQAAIETAINLKNTAERTPQPDEKTKLYADALKYFQIATKVGSSKGPSWLWKGFEGHLHGDMLYMGQAKDEERVARYKAIWEILEGYDYLPAKADEIDEICPLPPAKLPPWDGKLQWVEKWEKNEAPPLPSEERIGEMALLKNLNPETGLPVKIDFAGSRLLDPQTGKPLTIKGETVKMIRRLRNGMEPK